ncbi:MAG: hypothetical protein ACI81R_003383 [Bradymonadia bacterium]|jgi:hypothetical protein
MLRAEMQNMTTRLAAFGAVMLIAALAQGCGNDALGEGVADAGTSDLGAGCAGACDDLTCGEGQFCECGVCVEGCLDADGDGFGEGCAAGADCNDDAAAEFPGNPEVCDLFDNDCNGVADDGGVCDTECRDECTVGDTFCTGTLFSFCDDSGRCTRITDPSACPVGELCRGAEQSCVQACADRDGDGFGTNCDPGQPVDCDDEDGAAFPGNPEICDDVDNNCDGRTDENFVCDEPCEDACELGVLLCTGDGAGRIACSRGPDGCTTLSGVIPCREGEFCVEGVCGATPVCIDVDGDSFGPGCDAGDDCRPLDALSSPNAEERCDGVDNNCDGRSDEGGVCTPCPPTGAPSTIALGEGDVAYGAPLCGDVVALQALVDGLPLLLTTFGEAVPTISDTEGGASGNAGDLIWRSAIATLGGREGFIRPAAPFAVAAGRVDDLCADDANEPNNSPTSGTVTGALPLVATGTYCDGDLDFFDVQPIAGQVLVAEGMFYESNAAASDMRIWHNSQQVSWSFAGAAGLPGRYTHVRVDEAGTWAVSARSIAAGSAAYALSIYMVDAPACADDAADRPGSADDTFATAQVYRDGAGGTLCPGDYDVYDLGDIAGGGNMGVRLVAPAGVGYLVMKDGWGATRFNSFGAAGSNDTSFAISDSGRYYLIVLGADPLDAGDYSLSVSR